jgi:alkylation response protein AidB-like acyl-CoA dehydrogenase
MTASARVRRDPLGLAVSALNRLAGVRALDRLGLRKPTERLVFEATKTGFRTIGVLNRRFAPLGRVTGPARLSSATRRTHFDLTPTPEQQALVHVVTDFAAEVLRPAAAEADEACAAQRSVLKRAGDLGLVELQVPEEAGGAVSTRSATTGVLVAEAMAHGDMGLAVACLAPAAVSTALSLWGDGAQQAAYLPAFTSGEAAPAAALALLEPRPMFDPWALRATARRTPGGFVVDAVKSMVPRGADAEVFIVGAQLDDGGPGLFVVESSTPGLEVEAEPALGLRAASMSRLVLRGASLPPSALLGDGDPAVYAECVRLARIGWCGLALGTAEAVLDHVTPYVNDRRAFGEPISHRQAVAFMVADIAIELEGMRLVTYRAASRAEQGLSYARETALARRLCAERGMRIGTDGVQLLGGHGFVKEHPVERWYRDLRAVGLMEGTVLV